MGRTIYTPEQHKEAWEIYLKTQNFAEVARKFGMNWETAKNWSKPDFSCPYDCPFHGYDALMAEHEAALVTRRRLLEADVVSPISHAKATSNAIETLTTNVLGSDYPISRTVSERLAHLEWLWSKLFYHATGIPLDYGDHKAEEILTQYRKGLNVTSMDHAIRGMKMVQDMMDKLRAADEGKPSIEDEEDREMSISELRKLRNSLSGQSDPSAVKRILRGGDASSSASAIG